MRVAVIGAGIGGLTLAQGLHRAGVDVQVYDRDPQVDATGGYRLHLDEHACAALRRHLTPAHYQALLASSAPRSAIRRFTLADDRLRPFAVEPTDPAAEVLLIGRVALRTLLAHGLGERVRFGAEYLRHKVGDDGRVVAHFADGSTDVGDVLVGADGARSRVAEALAGHSTSLPAGFGGIAAHTPLTPATRRHLPAVLDGGPVLALGARGLAVFLSVHDPTTGPAVDPATCTEVPPVSEDPALIWGLNAAESVLAPAELHARKGPELVELALATLAGWPTDLQALIAAADPPSTAAFQYHAADPDTDLTPWPAGRVTALGDAVHAMPPTGGRAAAAAIRDADHLIEGLVAARDGRTTLPLAVHAFHRAMAGYAPEAIRTSLGPLRWIHRLDHPAVRGLARLGLPTLAAAHGLRTALRGRRIG